MYHGAPTSMRLVNSKLEMATYGHSYKSTVPSELIGWDGVSVMDGVQGGSGGAVICWFDKHPGNTSYCEYIDSSMTKTQWLELKRVYKLCNNREAKKKGEEGYSPAYKYGYFYDMLVHNVNAITKHARLDICVETRVHGLRMDRGTWYWSCQFDSKQTWSDTRGSSCNGIGC